MWVEPKYHQKCLEHKECKTLSNVSSTGAIPELPKGQKIKEVNEFDAEKVVGWYSKTRRWQHRLFWMQ